MLKLKLLIFERARICLEPPVRSRSRPDLSPSTQPSPSRFVLPNPSAPTPNLAGRIRTPPPAAGPARSSEVRGQPTARAHVANPRRPLPPPREISLRFQFEPSSREEISSKVWTPSRGCTDREGALIHTSVMPHHRRLPRCRSNRCRRHRLDHKLG